MPRANSIFPPHPVAQKLVPAHRYSWMSQIFLDVTDILAPGMGSQCVPLVLERLTWNKGYTELRE